MSNEIKFTTDEMNGIEEIQKKYASIQLQFGQIGFAKMRIENEINKINVTEQNLKKEFNDVQDSEEEFMSKITKKYGEGVLDPKTGVFTLNK